MSRSGSKFNRLGTLLFRTLWELSLTLDEQIHQSWFVTLAIPDHSFSDLVPFDAKDVEAEYPPIQSVLIQRPDRARYRAVAIKKGRELIEAAIGAGVAAFGLVVGFIVANQYRLNQRLVGQAMGLGAGVLMAVVAYALVLETIETAQHPSIVGAGMAAGAFVFYYGSRWLDQRSSSATASESEGGGGLPLALGAVLDGVPESMVIGIGAALTGEIGIPLVIAAFIANIAESLAATPELESSGMSRQSVLGIWVAILAASVITALIGYGLMASLAPNAGAMFNGFAAGAVLMVLSTSLIPEGYEKAKRVAGLLVVLGFAIGFSLEHLG